MGFRGLLASVAASCLFWLLGWVYTPAALALTPITLSDISYHECPTEMAKGTVTAGSSQAAKCYLVTGKAENTSNKLVVNADILVASTTPKTSQYSKTVPDWVQLRKCHRALVILNYELVFPLINQRHYS